MKTYEILTVKISHPTAGELTKQHIYYYDFNNVLELVEFYNGEIRNGYSPKG
jgi:hypothetical protein